MLYFKYIIYDDPPVPFLFPESVLHSWFISSNKLSFSKIKSAGYCEIILLNRYVHHIVIWGKSDIENVKSETGDDKILNDFFTKSKK